MPSSSLLSRSSDLLSGSARPSDVRPGSRLAAARSRAHRTRRRRTAALSLVLATGLIGFDLLRGGDALSASGAFSHPVATPESGTTSIAVRVVDPRADPAPPVIRQGEGTFTFASGLGPVAGSAGPVVQYRVAIENGTGVPAGTFAAAV